MLKSWLSFFRAKRLPRLRELPGVMLRVLSFGAAVGIGLSLIYSLVSGRGLPPLSHFGEFLLIAGSSGAIFSLSFYITCGLPSIVLPELLADQPEVRRRILTGLAGGVDAALGVMLAMLAIAKVFGGTMYFLGQDYFGLMLLVIASLGAVVSTVLLVIARGREEKRRAREELLKAQYSALQSQINPHFLFNTLNSISALVTRRPQAAQEMIGRLADMFRYALESQSSMVTLDQELGFVKNYVALEQIRFADRLRVELPEGEFRGIRVPGLALQPVMENAVKYGIAQRLEGGRVEMRVERSGDRCQITVRNQVDESTTPDLSDARVFREGHALYNIRERLRIRWNGQSAVRVMQESSGWVRTEIEFPVEA